jgi:hypothetical protein
VMPSGTTSGGDLGGSTSSWVAPPPRLRRRDAGVRRRGEARYGGDGEISRGRPIAQRQK